MSSGVPTHQHVFPSWEVYPRIHYFLTRYTDLLTRCKRVLGTLPQSFRDDDKIFEFEKLKKDFETGVRITVIGKDIDSRELVISSKGIQEKPDSSETPGINVFVYHTYTERLDLEGLEDIIALVNTHSSPILQTPKDGDIISICFGVGSPYSEEETDELRSIILHTLQEHCKELHIYQDNILLQPEGGHLKKMISDEIEKKIISGFQKIIESLRRFDLAEESSCKTEKILETDAVKNSIDEFLHCPSIFTEISSFTAGEEKNESFVESVIFRLCRHIKCAAVNPLANKYSLKSEVCNQVLHEIDFEEALAKSVSKNTRHQLKILGHPEKHLVNFGFFCKLLLKDMQPIFEKMEEKFSSMKRFSMVVRRLLFEIGGYLKQSTVTSECQTEARKLPEKLRKDILDIDGVYGIGTIYGRLEVHVEKEGLHSVATGESNKGRVEDDISEQKKHSIPGVDDTEMDVGVSEVQSKDKAYEAPLHKLKSRIAVEMAKHNFHYPYTVRFVLNTPTEMNGCFEPGDTLVCQSQKTGTVGAFVNSKDGTLYGLTCAHVVDGSRSVFVQKEGKHPFSICQQIIKTGQDPCRLIDIAALKVIPSLQVHCKDHLENTAKLVEKVDIAMEAPENLVGIFVHKFGAKTNLTKGIIISVDYSNFGPMAEDYVVIVDPLVATSSEDIPNLSNTFTSLLVTTPQNENEQNSERPNAEVVSAEKISNETENEDPKSKEAVQADKSSEYLKKKRRKLEPTDLSAKSQVSPNITIGISIIGDTNKSTLRTDTLFAGQDRVLSPMDLNEGNESLVAGYTGGPNASYSCSNAMLYVRKINETDNAKYVARSIFAEKGDSGSVICAQDLLHPGQKFLAVSMLSAGDLEVDGLDGKKTLSFMLKDGLTKLFEHCRVEIL